MKKQSNENRHLLTLKRSAPIYNAFMVSDFVDTEPLFETNENEIESITAIKFEIEYGQENNCFFDSTQESFQLCLFLFYHCVVQNLNFWLQSSLQIGASLNPPPSFLRKTSCWFQRRQKDNESTEAFCKDRQICLSGLVIKEKQKIKFSKCVKKERTFCNDITGTNFVCRVKGTSFSMNIDHLESLFVSIGKIT